MTDRIADTGPVWILATEDAELARYCQWLDDEFRTSRGTAWRTRRVPRVRPRRLALGMGNANGRNADPRVVADKMSRIRSSVTGCSALERRTVSGGRCEERWLDAHERVRGLSTANPAVAKRFSPSRHREDLQ